ncbi:MAG: hypothetical protein JNJ46_00845 [Myxococcales bacterium]|nr:hypothetical protein [Myxococcales bacterium]
MRPFLRFLHFSFYRGNNFRFYWRYWLVRIPRNIGDGIYECEFRVRDSGSGIPAQRIPHLFDRFWQADRADHRGAGLGLAIVRGLVQAHGGNIRVESSEGQGTTVFFSIPLAKRPPE